MVEARAVESGSFWPENWRALGIIQSAIRVGQYHWLEERLFEIVGAWVGETAEPEAKTLFRIQSYHHAARAAEWQKRLLSLGEHEVDRLSVLRDKHLGECLSSMQESDRCASERLTALYRVVMPRVINSYTHHLECTNSVSDAPLQRTLEVIIADVIRDQAKGEVLLDNCLQDDSVVTVTTEYQANLEHLFTDGGILPRLL